MHCQFSSSGTMDLRTPFPVWFWVRAGHKRNAYNVRGADGKQEPSLSEGQCKASAVLEALARCGMLLACLIHKVCACAHSCSASLQFSRAGPDVCVAPWRRFFVFPGKDFEHLLYSFTSFGLKI